ncbi:pilus assembly protein PilS [Neisseria gonorrhoeae]|uniref:Pilus assembly protein PilS n=1 Tax=Neisseria gonorrhoeae TaxID=485 RepID=A0AAX2TSA1_NEIGO|nr:pilus assembly protein PilS [Neisseria gonorrhoeae]AVH82906.1 pilus assembly protein PilS [Neisseria gonorrhoeae]AVI59949.1 pilus assembly protein PilS [Neisseria gonorrhoeae]AZG19047.1 pilus assembly protein PilS [Neisseria gonorrhoeae]AZG21624.1 pilus assembly protein PilS [Neisseria gonorrhoeae]
MSSFPRRRESRLVGTETYRVKRFLQFYVPDSRLRGDNDSGISTSNPLFIST